MSSFRTLGFLAALACAATAALADPPVPAVPAAKAPAASADYSLREGRFSVKTPAGWTASRDSGEDDRQKVYGVRFSGPRAADGVLATISIAYYPPDNTLFKGGAEEFLKRNLGTDDRFVPPAGETTSAIRKSVSGGLPARSFTRRSREYLPPDRTDGKAVVVVEEVAVIDAPAGFYVLEFKASETRAAKLKRIYSRFLKGARFASEASSAPARR